MNIASVSADVFDAADVVGAASNSRSRPAHAVLPCPLSWRGAVAGCILGSNPGPTHT